MKPIESEMLGLIQLIGGWISAGAKTDEILERLAAPDSAGRELLERAKARRDAGRAFLGRDPEAIMVKTEEPPKPNRSRARRKKRMSE